MELDYRKKIELCKKLGAEKFQKAVFTLEHYKYKVIKKIMPNYIKKMDKFYDKKRDKELRKTEDPGKRQQIIDNFRMRKLILRKEFHGEGNINYHMDINKPLEILEYLNWNKKVHVQGLTMDAIVIPIITGLSIVYTPAVIPLLIYELLSATINFQCINLQNYNIYRIKEKEEILKKGYERQQKRNIQKYGKVSEAIADTFAKTDDIPTKEDVIGNCNLEQLQQLRELVLANYERKTNTPKQKKIGGFNYNAGNK